MYSKKKRTGMTKGGMKPRTKKVYGVGMSRKKANTGRLMYGAGGESVMPTAKPN